MSQIAAKQNDLALIYNFVGRYAEAVPLASQALESAAALLWDSMASAAAQTLAEAHLGLTNWDAATQYATQVIQLEDADILPDGLRALGEALTAKATLTLPSSYFNSRLRWPNR